MTMEDRVQAHKNLVNQLNDIYAKKNHDYGDSFHDTFVEEGFAMPRIRLTDKLNRFKTLTRNAETTGGINNHVTDESIRDTLMDLANYAIMTIIELDRAKGLIQFTGKDIATLLDCISHDDKQI